MSGRHAHLWYHWLWCYIEILSSVVTGCMLSQAFVWYCVSARHFGHGVLRKFTVCELSGFGVWIKRFPSSQQNNSNAREADMKKLARRGCTCLPVCYTNTKGEVLCCTCCQGGNEEGKRQWYMNCGSSCRLEVQSRQPICTPHCQGQHNKPAISVLYLHLLVFGVWVITLSWPRWKQMSRDKKMVWGWYLQRLFMEFRCPL